MLLLHHKDGSNSKEVRDREVHGNDSFGLWKFRMLAQLEIQGLLSVLDEDTTSVSDERKL